MPGCSGGGRMLCSQSALDGCLLLDQCREGVLCLDSAGVIKYANPTACHILTRPAVELVGRNIDTALGWDASTEVLTAAGSSTDLQPVLAYMASPVLEAYVAAGGGRGTPIEYRVAPVNFSDGSAGSVMTFHDISGRLETEEQLRHLAHHDPLTELPNRRLLSERLDYEIARAGRYGESFALHLVDLDDFKGVNDRFGHPIGDQLLVRLADRLRAAVRVSDTVARIGGDEFAVIQVAVDEPEDAAALARKLLAECRKPVHLDGFELFPGVTIGVSIYSGEQSEEALWGQADAALYQAKARGKNTFVVVNDEITRSILADSRIVGALEHAVDYQQFELVYQPQFSLASRAMVGVEALLRWRHPEFGDIGPAGFIPLAEEHGLIHTIGLWVLTEVCRQARLWIDAGVPFGRISFNVSPLQLASREHFSALVSIVEEASIPWAMLEIEVTETAYFGASREVLVLLEALQHKGVRIAIDDFGTGYSSLLALRQIKANSLKIDRAFIKELHDAESAGIVKETIALAHTMGMAAVAEGVEASSQLMLLDRFGCDRSQGFHLGIPCKAADLEHQFFDTGSLGATLIGGAADEDIVNVADEMIPWSDVYETGIAQIDLQHQKLVELINRLAQTAQISSVTSHLGEVLDEVVRYVDYHFRCEEAFMARHHVVSHHVDYHRDKHMAGIEKVRGWIGSYHAGSFSLGDLCGDLSSWLVSHILAEDKTLGEQIAAINRGADPDEAYRQTMVAAALECR